MKLSIRSRFEAVDIALTNWMARYGILVLRVSLGAVFLWFGALKLFPGLSPAENLATRTIEVLSFGLVPPSVSLPTLAVWECLVGLGLILGAFLRATLLLLWLQMLGAVTPLVLFPGEVFQAVPYAPTLEGQYIIKNLVLVAAGLVIGSTLRGGWTVADPTVARIERERHPSGH